MDQHHTLAPPRHSGQGDANSKAYELRLGLTCTWSSEDKDNGDLFRVKRGRTRGGRSRDGGHGGGADKLEGRSTRERVRVRGV